MCILWILFIINNNACLLLILEYFSVCIITSIAHWIKNPLCRTNTNKIHKYNYRNFSFITIASLWFKIPCSECQSKELNLHEQFALRCMGRYIFTVTFCHFTFEWKRGLRSMIIYVELVISECDSRHSLSLYFLRYPNLIRHHTKFLSCIFVSWDL